MTPLAIAAFVLLLATPAYALSRLASTIDWRILLAAPLLLSLAAFLAYRTDKHRAIAGEWRIPESSLHFLELIGGWPGAFLAQRQFRHKISKVSFQIVFWMIVLVHQFLAADSLRAWQWSKGVFHFIESQTVPTRR